MTKKGQKRFFVLKDHILSWFLTDKVSAILCMFHLLHHANCAEC